MLNRILGREPLAAGGDWRKAIGAAEKTEPSAKSDTVERFPVDGLVRAAVRANNRVIDAQCCFEKAQAEALRIVGEQEDLVRQAHENLRQARVDLRQAQSKILRATIDAGALEGVTDLNTLLSKEAADA